MRADRRAVSDQFGLNLREARQWLGWQQKELAQRSSVRQSYLSQLENGLICPRLDMVVTLARPLEVQLADLLHGIE